MGLILVWHKMLTNRDSCFFFYFGTSYVALCNGFMISDIRILVLYVYCLIHFKMLKNMSPVVDENQYISAREVRNKKRNRYSNILPGKNNDSLLYYSFWCIL